MELFGTTPNQPIQECLAQVRTADVFVLVLAYRHGSVPTGRARSMVEREYWEAKRMGIPVLAYVADKKAYLPDGDVNPRVMAFRTYLREKHVAQCFRSRKDLAAQVAVDLGREIRKLDNRFHTDSWGGLAHQHETVVAAVEAGDLAKAKRLNDAILQANRMSPRAQYNQACILSLLSTAETNESKRTRLLKTARGRLHDALKFGILILIAMFSDRSSKRNKNPATWVLKDPHLKPLFAAYPELTSQVMRGLVEVPRGCGC
jgi:hypothetical protein